MRTLWDDLNFTIKDCFGGIEFWEVGPFQFEAYAFNDDDTEVELKVSWNEYPQTIGKYPIDTKLFTLKEKSVEWLKARCDDWKMQADCLIARD